MNTTIGSDEISLTFFVVEVTGREAREKALNGRFLAVLELKWLIFTLFANPAPNYPP